LFVEPLKASGGCPIGTFFNSYSSWFILSFAPRLVLMRCTTRSLVVFLDRSFQLSIGVSKSYRSMS
jgi:hypothetical protein